MVAPPPDGVSAWPRPSAMDPDLLGAQFDDVLQRDALSLDAGPAQANEQGPPSDHQLIEDDRSVALMMGPNLEHTAQLLAVLVDHGHAAEGAESQAVVI